MTPLEHTDHILTAKKGDWLVVRTPLRYFDCVKGEWIPYSSGDRLRVELAFSSGELYALDENARSVRLDREQLTAVEFEDGEK